MFKSIRSIMMAELTPVMADEGPSSTPYGARVGKGVDGGPPPNMTSSKEFV